MPRGKGKKNKDPFADLSEEFRDSIATKDEAGIRSEITTAALNQVALMSAKEQDTDFHSKKEAAKEAGAVYREGSKANKLKIEFCKRELESRGKESGSFEQE